ncbi:MAG: MFS transporter [Pseudomonadota bacterium]
MGAGTIDAKRDRLVILASTLGTVFEWYDFFIYGTLANIVAGHFFPSDNPAVSFLIFLASFGVGFGMRPLGALFFGVLGDRLGRKYTFLVTIALMGVATAAVGVLPTYESIGVAAPILLVLCRVLQGLALGGEYGGAAIYVAEHAPSHRRGLYTSFIQSGVVGGFLLSLIVVLGAGLVVSDTDFRAWGWRIPFLFSLILLGISLWIRLKLKESPVFKAMKEAGTVARNPLRESFDSWRKIRMVLVALFGVAAGLTVVWYTAQFQALYFLQNSLRLEDDAARLVIGVGALFSLGWFILFGWLSDKLGRRPIILAGYVLTIALMFPIFHWMGAAANPDLAAAMERAPVVVRGSDCSYDPFAKDQATACGRILDALSRKGVAYQTAKSAEGSAPVVTIGGTRVNVDDSALLDAALTEAGYRLEKITPTFGAALRIALGIIAIGCLSGMTYGPAAALLVEMFPARVRYTSMSVPYHIGTGYFGGFLPFISQYMVARSGDPFAGLWYTVGVAAMALVVTFLWLPETAGKELE